MNEFFLGTKNKIGPFLDKFFLQSLRTYKPVNRWSADALARLAASAGRGKMVRGGLVYLAYYLAGKRPDKTCLTLAAAMEIVHTALLIHDDIMDCDGVRRGKPTIYKQYEQMAHIDACAQPAHTGEAMGICVGDVAIFLSMELISSLPTSQAIVGQRLMRLFSRELSCVGFAQMQDVYCGAVKSVPTRADIMNLYRYKTARYTFSLPLMLGSMAAGKSMSSIRRLEKLGEHLGVIFQIKDDELGIFGDEEKTGKPVGSDIREDKKTLYYYFLQTRATADEQAELADIFGNPQLTVAHVRRVHELLARYMIEKEIAALLEKEVVKANRIISAVSRQKSHKQILSELLAFNLNRAS
jgi:geranylgeranyl diphosphate synthase type I